MIFLFLRSLIVLCTSSPAFGCGLLLLSFKKFCKSEGVAFFKALGSIGKSGRSVLCAQELTDVKSTINDASKSRTHSFLRPNDSLGKFIWYWLMDNLYKNDKYMFLFYWHL